ncbi:GlxA family transcriptional regulator [Pseudonocardia spinosispora]|uniref:GlxA family transcriptional regulator n=1 Tax=Pseudonocardia spinosispora TaxID=103441 RepID=UPI000686F433|nr:DJ-1/PfpI family protein [Pseudonocardia spinosispora]
MDSYPTHLDKGTSRRVAVLVFDGVTMLDVSGPAEVLSKAATFGAHYELTPVSPAGGEVRTSTGMVLAGTRRFDELHDLDLAIVAGSDDLPVGPIDEELSAAARGLCSRARVVASVCTGAFVLAAIGLLDGKRAATHWRHTATLARRHPRVDVHPDAIYVRDGDVLTSAGVSAGIDLALAVVEHDHGAETARQVARELVVFLQRPGGQSQFGAATQGPAPRSAPLRALQAAIVAEPTANHSLSSMAALAAMSPRQLSRLFHEQVGTTPVRWVESVRLETAQRLLLDGYSVTAAAEKSGLGSDETLRRVFSRRVGVAPSDYRQRFATTS